jgi:CheY-like chemotaxis protein
LFERHWVDNVAATMGARSKHRVLICEDDRMTADLLAAAVQSGGHEILLCHDGRTAIDRVAEWGPTAGIIDIGLPGVTGYGVAQHIRGLCKTRLFAPQMLLIAITAYDSPADIAMARYAGFNWHFAKPARPSLLLSVLENPNRAALENGDGTPLDRSLDGDWKLDAQRRKAPPGTIWRQ